MGLTGGATDVDPQSQAAVAVVVGGRGWQKEEKEGEQGEREKTCEQ